jgi:hypothetical protein
MDSNQLQCYSRFKHHLESSGFTVYPGEFDCGNSNHPMVDIAARMGAFFWAFEYKSENDGIARGIEQVACYANWFDYVVLVSEKWIDHTRSKAFWKLASMGVGIWTFVPSSYKLIERKNPRLQSPNEVSRRLVVARFGALQRSESKSSPQRQLTRWDLV